MAASDLVFGVGDQVCTWGRFLADPAGDWLDLARGDDLLPKPPGWKSDRSIRLIGADAGAVPTEFAANRVPGYMSVVGIWRDETIEVTAQSTEIPRQEPTPDWTDPPCQPPPGGWPHGVAVGDLHFHLGDLESSGAMVTRVVFRPSADQEVLVIAATDPWEWALGTDRGRRRLAAAGCCQPVAIIASTAVRTAYLGQLLSPRLTVLRLRGVVLAPATPMVRPRRIRKDHPRDRRAEPGIPSEHRC